MKDEYHQDKSFDSAGLPKLHCKSSVASHLVLDRILNFGPSCVVPSARPSARLEAAALQTQLHCLSLLILIYCSNPSELVDTLSEHSSSLANGSRTGRLQGFSIVTESS